MRYLMPVLTATALVVSTGPVYADVGDQLAKLLPDDGAKKDRFGVSVAISGTTVIIGAYHDDDHDDDDDDSGSAYLFDTTSGRQIAKLLPNDRAEFDQFGSSVAISGTIAIVGVPWDDDNGNNSGSAYLFDISDPANPTQIAKLLPDDGAAKDNFGGSVAISGATAIVGASLDDDACPDDPFCQSGAVYLFDATTGRQIAKLLPNDGAAGDFFGSSVAISGATAIVGASLDDDNGKDSGSAYLFDISDPANSKQIAKLLPDDGAKEDHFGSSVAISGATAVVGASLDDDNGNWSGSAYLFDTATGLQSAKLLPNDGAAEERFGVSVAISGTTAIVGAHQDAVNGRSYGSAYLFDTTTGQQIAKLLSNDLAQFDKFGISVAISGTTAIVGAYEDDDSGLDSGSAYLFDAASASARP